MGKEFNMTLEQLVERLNYHRDYYYNGEPPSDAPVWLQGEPPISDDEFDDLFNEVQRLDPSNPAVNDVGSVNVTGGDVKHESRMGSLSKVKKIEDIKEWFNKYAKISKKIWILPKYDGVSLKILFRNGNFELSSTRGTGLVGKNVSASAKGVKTIPSNLQESVTADIRGEIVMPRSVFQRLNEIEIRAGREPFKNVRNAASGSLKQEDSSISASRGLVFYAYDILSDYDFDTYSLKIEFLKKLGFDTGKMRSFEVIGNDFSEIEAYLSEFNGKRKDLDFATDGAVIVLDSLEDQENAGWSSNNHHPNGKLAFKFESEKKQTKVLGYKLQVGKTGRIIPVGIIEPVEIDGSLISNPTFHNFGTMLQYGLFKGAVVNVKKANDVIPYVEYKKVVSPVFEKFENGEYPRCPCCGSITEFDGVNLWCRNDDCSERFESKIIHFLKTTGCLNIGEKTVQALINSGLVKKLPDLFDDRLDTACIAKALCNSDPNAREAQIVTEAIGKIKNIPMNVFIESLSIPNVGTGTSKMLASVYPDIETFLKTASYEKLVSLSDIGPTTAESIVKAVNYRSDEIRSLASKIGIIVKKLVSSRFDGKSFLFTGTLSQGRKVYEKIVEDNGGKLSGSVSKTLDYLVVGEAAGSKLEKAKKLGVKTLTETEFMTMAG